MNKIGKRGKINIQANRDLKEYFLEIEVERCERCGTGWGLTFAHRHKRYWYYSRPELLSDPNQVLLLCLDCHRHIEPSRERTEELFLRLRGPEKIV